MNFRWIELAKDYVQWWVLVLAVLNLQALLPECLLHVEFNNRKRIRKTDWQTEDKHPCRIVHQIHPPSQTCTQNMWFHILSAIHFCALKEIRSLSFFVHFTAIYFTKTHTCMWNPVQSAYNMKLMVQNT